MRSNFQSCFVGSLDENEEYIRATENEKFVRKIAFLNITETIGGFECKQIALKNLLLFQLDGNSVFDLANIPSHDDFKKFLWILSPHYGTGLIARWHQKRLVTRFERLFVWGNQPRTRWLATLWARQCARKSHAYAVAVAEARKFIDETFQDRQGGTSEAIEFYSDAAWFCATFAREFGFSISETMSTPIVILFQMLKENRQYHLGKKAGLTNRSSDILHL